MTRKDYMVIAKVIHRAWHSKMSDEARYRVDVLACDMLNELARTYKNFDAGEFKAACFA